MDATVRQDIEDFTQQRYPREIAAGPRSVYDLQLTRLLRPGTTLSCTTKKAGPCLTSGASSCNGRTRADRLMCLSKLSLCLTRSAEHEFLACGIC